jgi:microcystin-dependent protein
VVRCTAKTATTFTVDRSYDGTLGVGHGVGSVVEHTHAGIDFREAGIPRLTTAERNALAGIDLWDGRVVWNSEADQLEVNEPSIGWGVLMPAGIILPYGGSVLPSGWLWAQGQAVNRTTYARLFGAVGTTFGVGDGSTTFNVPDMQRRFPLGRHISAPYDVLGASGGAMDHTHTNPSTSSTGAHTHTQGASGASGGHNHTNPNTATGSGTQAGTNNAGGPYNPSLYNYKTVGDVASHVHAQGSTGSVAAHTHTNPTTASSGSHSHSQADTGGSNPPYLVVNYIVKA